MTETYSTALLILLVGMITIFLVLSLVVISGNLLIRIVNSLHREEKVTSKKSTRKASIIAKEEDDMMEGEKLAALVGAIDILTQGRGRITSIKKIN